MSMLDNFDFGDGQNLVEPPRGFKLLPEGDYRLTVKEVVKNTSGAGNEQYVLTLSVAGQDAEVRHWLTILPDSPERTRWNFHQFWKSFSIAKEHWKQPNMWIGRLGAGHLIVDEYTDKEGKARKNNKVDRFLSPMEAASALSGNRAMGQSQAAQPMQGFMNVPMGMEQLPFN